MSVLQMLVIQCSEEFEINACFLKGIFVYSAQCKDLETAYSVFNYAFETVRLVAGHY